MRHCHRLACTLLLGLALATSAQARPERAQEAQGLSLNSAVAQAQQRHGGRVLGAQLVQDDQGGYYEIRLLVRPGHVRVLRVDPRTGREF